MYVCVVIKTVGVGLGVLTGVGVGIGHGSSDAFFPGSIQVQTVQLASGVLFLQLLFFAKILVCGTF